MTGFAKEIRPDKVAIYIRWSTEDQGDGTTLVVQQEGCQHYVLSQGWRVTPSLIFIDDGYSGGTLERPRMSDLRLAVKAGEVDCVVVYKLDRLSRSVMDTVNLVLGEWDGRTYLKSAREPIDTTSAMGKQFFYMLVSYAEWERSVIRERTFSGKMRRAKEGKQMGGPVPLGYRRTQQPGILDVVPEQAELVRRIFRMYLEEQGGYKIADTLNREGIPSPTGIKWHMNTILKLLRNPVYAGELVYGRLNTNPRRQRDKSEPWFIKNPDPIKAEAQFPAIISREDFDRVQALMEQRTPRSTGVRALASEYLLTGILQCQCGDRMASHTSVSPTGKVYHYYSCQNRVNRGSSACKCGLILQDWLDEAVERELQGLLDSEEAYQEFMVVRWASLEAQMKEAGERRSMTAAALQNMTEQAKKLNRDYRGGTLSAALYEENRREIDAEVVQLKDRITYLERLERSLAAQLHERDALREIFDLVRRWSELDMPKRKFVLRTLVNGVVAYKPQKSDEITVRVLWKFSAPAQVGAGEM